jgi:FeS assembly SUF system regulator
MLRMGKLTDYGTLILTHLVDRACIPASGLAERTRLGAPTVSKILKALGRAGIVHSARGANGGYTLARDAAEISAADIIDALEGPVAITECSSIGGACELETVCGVGSAWQHINVAIRRALDDISLAQLANWQRGTIPPMDLHMAHRMAGSTINSKVDE